MFERIYFSRANDADIHRERKALGAALAPALLDAVGGDLGNTFFSYIPNSAQVAFHGLLEALWTEGLAEGRPVRFGQVAVKDAKFRTFIADAAARREIGRHVYDPDWRVPLLWRYEFMNIMATMIKAGRARESRPSDAGRGGFRQERGRSVPAPGGTGCPRAGGRRPRSRG